jgi:hypothetical protein
LAELFATDSAQLAVFSGANAEKTLGRLQAALETSDAAFLAAVKPWLMADWKGVLTEDQVSAAKQNAARKMQTRFAAICDKVYASFGPDALRAFREQGEADDRMLAKANLKTNLGLQADELSLFKEAVGTALVRYAANDLLDVDLPARPQSGDLNLDGIRAAEVKERANKVYGAD